MDLAHFDNLMATSQSPTIQQSYNPPPLISPLSGIHWPWVHTYGQVLLYCRYGRTAGIPGSGETLDGEFGLTHLDKLHSHLLIVLLVAVQEDLAE